MFRLPPAARRFLILLLLLAATPAPGAVTGATPGGDIELLDPDQAFQLQAQARGDQVQLRFTIADGYYLYRDRIRIDAAAGASQRLLGPIRKPPGIRKQDRLFGAVQTYRRQVVIEVPLLATPSNHQVRLVVTSQGCADIGICFPPQRKVLQIKLPGAGGDTSRAGPPVNGTAMTGSALGQLSETDQLAQGVVQGSLWLVLASFFGWGLLLAFTPCVLPMVPILAAIIAGQGERLGGRRGFSLAAVYVLAMALTYTGAGFGAALLGQNLQAMFQNPVVLVVFSGIFIALSLAMFGVYELQMPAAWQTRLQGLSQAQHGGRYGGVAVMGALSALIVGPCVAAPLAAALIVIGGSGDPLRGGLALFALSLGMGMPLLAVGAFGDRVLPKLGPWMNLVKQLFGLLLLAVAIYLLARILPTAVVMGLWSGLLIVAAILFALSPTAGFGKGVGWVAQLRVRQGLGALALVYASLLAVGAASGAEDPLNPLARVFGVEQPSLQFIRVRSLAELDHRVAEANRNGQPVMLDLYADWCITCKQLEAETFSDQRVHAALNNTVLLQADLTDYNAADKALLTRYQLLGPPAILFFDTRGREIRSRRVIGFMAAADFQRTIHQALRS